MLKMPNTGATDAPPTFESNYVAISPPANVAGPAIVRMLLDKQ